MNDFDPTQDAPSPTANRDATPPEVSGTDDLLRLPSRPEHYALPDRSGNGPPEVTIREIGDYRIIREIGRGGMGVVYEAEQVSLNRQVALKILPTAAVLDQRQLQRFKNEAQAAAMLHHPNIVPIFGVGSDRGVHYFAMHFVEGPTLADIVKELRSRSELGSASGDGSAVGPGAAPAEAGCRSPGALPASFGDSSTSPAIARLSTEQSTSNPTYFRSVVKLTIQVADALQHAHELGILHRDIKPGNLLFDERGNVWVTDFGLARVRGDAELTVTGDLLGTLRYMSPEQALAKRVPVDHRTDIYSLGVTLYELVTLAPAVHGADRQEILQQIAFEEPQPPRRINKRIPVELETIILKATAKNPASRYDSAADLADDLRNFLDDKPIKARRATIAERAFLWSRRHRALVGAALLLLVTVAVGSSVAAVLVAGAWSTAERNAQEARAAFAREQQARQKEAAARAEAERQELIAQESFRQARQAVDEYFTTVSQSTLLEAPGLQPLRKELLDAALEYYKRFAEQQSDDPVVNAELAKIYLRVGETAITVGKVNEAISAAASAADLIEELWEKYPDRRDWQVRLAGFYTGGRFFAQQRFTAQEGLVAYGTLTRIITLLEALGAANPQIREFKGDLAGMLRYVGEAIILKGNDRSPAWPAARQAVTRAYEVWTELHAVDPESAFFRRELARGGALLALTVRDSDPDRAYKLLLESGQLLRALVAESPDVRENRMLLAMSSVYLGNLYRQTGRLDQANDVYREAVQLGQALLLEVPSSGGLAWALTLAERNLGGTLLQRAGEMRDRKEFDQAEKLYRECLALAQAAIARHQASNPINKLNVDDFARIVLEALGPMLRQAGKHEEAERLYRESLPVARKHFDEYWSTWMTAALADVKREQRNFDEAEKLYRESLVFARQVHVAQRATRSDGKLDVGQFRSIVNTLASMLKDLGRIDEVERLYRESLPVTHEHFDSGWAAWMTKDFGDVKRQQKQLDEAEALYRESLELARVSAGGRLNIGQYAQLVVHHLGPLLQESAKLDEAEQLYRESLPIAREHKDHEFAYRMTVELARLAQKRKKFDEAERCYREARDLRRQTDGDTNEAVGSLAALLADKQDSAAAVDVYKDEIEFRRKKSGDAHESVNDALSRLVRFGIALRDRDELDASVPSPA